MPETMAPERRASPTTAENERDPWLMVDSGAPPSPAAKPNDEHEEDAHLAELLPPVNNMAQTPQSGISREPPGSEALQDTSTSWISALMPDAQSVERAYLSLSMQSGDSFQFACTQPAQYFGRTTIGRVISRGYLLVRYGVE